MIASALSVLSFNVNYRDSGTGLVPTFDQLANKNQQQVGYDASQERGQTTAPNRVGKWRITLPPA